MTRDAKLQYLKAIRERYEKSTKKGKTLILDEFCKVCMYRSRKHAIRILRGRADPRQRRPGPKGKYDRHFEFHLAQLWRWMGYMCSKKMVAALPMWLGHYRDPTYHSGIKEKLLSISSSSIDRLLKKYRVEARKGLSSTRGSELLKNQIAIELFKGNVQIGYVEADTVAHCGDSLAGAFANTLTVTDIRSCWTENRAVWRKEAPDVKQAFQAIEGALPFSVTHVSTDNGNEFLNHCFFWYCKNHPGGPIRLTRKRPYKKNDAAHVEQKNWTHVRQLFGYSRVDNPEIVALMNEIYRAYWSPLMNFFCPVMKLIEKKRIGAKIKKTYDKPRTPFERILELEDVSQGIKNWLQDQHKCYNPFDLKQRLEAKLSEFHKLVSIARQHKMIEQIPA